MSSKNFAFLISIEYLNEECSYGTFFWKGNGLPSAHFDKDGYNIEGYDKHDFDRKFINKKTDNKKADKDGFYFFLQAKN